MPKAIAKVGWCCVVLLAATVAISCSPKARDRVTSSARALTTANGLGQNGLTTNGLVENGMWTNGMWTNGMWTNGMWTNGMWTNGMWTNGMWTNGMWTNGMWTNGMWTNGMWTNGLTGPAAIPGTVLRSSAYARELLQYVYSCAMPAATQYANYDTTLDPNEGAPLVCAADGDCDTGYSCSSDGKCVIPLRGGGANGSGLGVNADETTWWESGTCDESCQRWVSACVLARTNAYGVHVQISMRAPANAPQAIKNALATTPAQDGNPSEATVFSTREGAYYGNIFETRPVPNAPPTPGFSGPTTGAIAATPTYTACAGPDSNVPQLTKRFESSQGDQLVISVPGVCLGNGIEPGACAGSDTDSSSATYGAVQHCYTKTNLTSQSACAMAHGPTGVAEPADPTCYDEVITVFLAEPIAVCGNGVCEPPNETPSCCPTDCHPATWAKDFSPLLHTGSAYQAPACTLADSAAGNCPQPPPVQFAPNAMSAVAADSTIAVAGSTSVDICPVGCPLSLGNAVLPASAGAGVLVKYNADGSAAWPSGGVRFGSATPMASVAPLQSVSGVIVGTNLNSTPTSPDHDGNITVVGVTTQGGTSNQQIWISSFQPDGTPLGTWIPQLVGKPTLSPLGGTLAFDSQSNLVLAANAVNPGTTDLTDVAAIAIGAGGEDYCAVHPGGTVECWGRDASSGQLGNGTVNSSFLPVPVSGLNNATAVSMGDEFTCALLSSGTVECWGQNVYGQLGIGTRTGPQTCPIGWACSTTPVAVSGLTGATAISSGGDYTCALLAGGTVTCWGTDPLGTTMTTPTTVAGLTGATSISAGPNSACAVVSGGTVRCWGSNIYGALGNGSTTSSASPVTVAGLTGATAVSVGLHTACALLSGGSVSCWGDNGQGQLGTGSTTGPQTCVGAPCSTTPLAVTGLSAPVTALTVSYINACARLSNGTVACWGDNEFGQLGIGTVSGPQTCAFGDCSTTPVAVNGLAGSVTAIATGGYADGACAILSDGTAECWGGGQSFPTKANQAALFLMKTALPAGVPQAPIVWMTTVNDGGGAATFTNSLAVDPNDNVVAVTAFGQSNFHTQGMVHKICSDGSQDRGTVCPDGSTPWSAGSLYLAVAVDSSGDIYAAGMRYLSSMVGTPFVTKFTTNGSNVWQSKTTNAATAVCPAGSSCVSNPAVQGVSMGFDGGGNLVLASFGNAAIGGGLSFGYGPGGAFPAFPTYGSPNIFLSAYEPVLGSPLWVNQIQTILSGSLHGMALGNQGQIVVAGNYSGSMQVDGQLLVTAAPESPSVTDSFLASFAEPAPATPAIGSTSGTCGGPSFATVPSDIYVPATSPAGACVFFMPPTSTWATTVTCSPAPNTTFPIGTTPVTCTSYDAYGHSANTAPFDVNVFNPAPPVLTSVPADITRIVTGPTAITYTAPMVIDQLANPATCSACAALGGAGGPPGPPPPCTPPTVLATCTPASGSTFQLGTTTVSCTTTDSGGRTASTSFTVTLVPEVKASCVGATGAPVVVPTPPGTCGVQVSNASAVAGSCGGAELASCSFSGHASETLGPGDYTIPIVATAVDLSTTATCTSYIRVVDNQNPVVTCANPTVECSGNGGATVTPTATCTDNCSCTASCATGFYAVGSSPGTCSASDAASNSATCHPTVKVVDTIAPSTTATVGPNPVPNRYITINLTSYTVTPKGGGTPISGMASCWTSAGLSVALKAADTCALKQLTYSLTGAQTGSATAASGSATINVTKNGSTTVTYYATDSAGNAEATKFLPVFVSALPGAQFGFSCAPSASLKNLPPHGTVTAKGTVSISDSKTGKTTSQSFSFTQSY